MLYAEMISGRTFGKKTVVLKKSDECKRAYVKVRGKCLPRSKTEFQPMSETNSFVSEHRFDSGCSSEGEHKVRPYIGFGHWLDSGSCE